MPVPLKPLGAIHKGRPQNFQDFGFPPPPCPNFGLIYSSKSTQPTLLCLLLDQPPLPPSVRTSFMYSPLVDGLRTNKIILTKKEGNGSNSNIEVSARIATELTSGLSLEMATIISSPLTSFSQSSDSVSCRAVSYVCGPKTRWSANWEEINSQNLQWHDGFMIHKCIQIFQIESQVVFKSYPPE